MATIKTFEDLECWQEARKFVGLVYRLTQNEFFRKDFELVKQVRGSVISSMANIAEGFHRNSTKDFLKFLDYSCASVAETVSPCYIALDQQYISKSELERLKKQADIVGKKVNNFIAYLNRTLPPKNPVQPLKPMKPVKPVKQANPIKPIKNDELQP